ncbi:Holliday junction ATP-dependent DNA helicase RuvA [Legionella hackeliae]|nr:Holliday junction ATP-dependent DNA helicase RuvA [Legionella hackeliae]
MRDSIKQFSSQVDVNYSLQQPLLKQEQSEAISALEALGYKQQEAVKVVKKIDDGNKSCEQLIRQALQLLASR